MSAHTTIEAVIIDVIAWQCDGLGYIRCGDHINPGRGGKIHELEARDVLRQADIEGLWTCDVCNRHVTIWPRRTETVNCIIEHTAARIF